MIIFISGFLFSFSCTYFLNTSSEEYRTCTIYHPHLFVGPMNLASVRKDYSLHWHFRNCNHTSEIPKISTRHPQTPNEAIGTQSAMFAIQEVLKKVRMARCTGSLNCLFSCTNYNGTKHVWNLTHIEEVFLHHQAFGKSLAIIRTESILD